MLDSTTTFNTEIEQVLTTIDMCVMTAQHHLFHCLPQQKWIEMCNNNVPGPKMYWGDFSRRDFSWGQFHKHT